MKCSFSRRNFGLAMVLVIPLAAIAMGAAAAGRAMAPPVPPVIATIDIDRVVTGLDEYKAMQQALQDRGKQFQTELDAKKALLEEDKKRHDVMPEGAEKKQLAQKMIRDDLQLSFDRKYATQFMDQMAGAQVREILEHVTAACRELATKSRYTMIVGDDSAGRFSRGGGNEIMSESRMKRLWYVETTHDVTAELVVLMNNQYAAGGGQVPSAPGTPSRP